MWCILLWANKDCKHRSVIKMPLLYEIRNRNLAVVLEYPMEADK